MWRTPRGAPIVESRFESGRFPATLPLKGQRIWDGWSASARAGDVGEAYDEVDAVREGDDLEIAFNCGYLLDALSVIETDGVAFEMSEPLSPAVLRPEGEDDYLCVVMPMEKGGE